MVNKKIVIIGLFVVSVAVTVFILIQMSPRHQAKETIETFYRYEQGGQYAGSWNLFHSQMKVKFDKGHYLQDRAHVFMNHFGVTTFSFSLSDVDKLSEWQLDKDAEVLQDVYKVAVTQTFKGKYGNFALIQDVYAVKEKGEWKVLWNYRK